MEMCSVICVTAEKMPVSLGVSEPCSVFLHEACLPEKLRGPLHGHKTDGLDFLVYCYTYLVQRMDKKKKTKKRNATLFHS